MTCSMTCSKHPVDRHLVISDRGGREVAAAKRFQLDMGLSTLDGHFHTFLYFFRIFLGYRDIIPTSIPLR
jgi:hypothetical protein